MLPQYNSTFLFNLCNIECRNLEAKFIQHILLDLPISRFALCTCQIKLIQFNFNVYMLIDIKFGQKCYRLDVHRFGEHIYGLYFLQGIAFLCETFYISCQGGDVAGNIDNFLRFYFADSVNDFFAAAGANGV